MIEFKENELLKLAYTPDCKTRDIYPGDFSTGLLDPLPEPLKKFQPYDVIGCYYFDKSIKVSFMTNQVIPDRKFKLENKVFEIKPYSKVQLTPPRGLHYYEGIHYYDLFSKEASHYIFINEDVRNLFFKKKGSTV